MCLDGTLLNDVAFYSVACAKCGWSGDVWQSMSERGVGRPYPPCFACGSSATERANFREIMVHGMDTERAPGSEWSHALGEPGDTDPVYVKDRGAWRELLKRKGLKPVEDGEVEANKAAFQKRVQERQKADIQNAMGEALSVYQSGGHQGVVNVLREPSKFIAPKEHAENPGGKRWDESTAKAAWNGSAAKEGGTCQTA
jgi:hypothetical protein